MARLEHNFCAISLTSLFDCLSAFAKCHDAHLLDRIVDPAESLQDIA